MLPCVKLQRQGEYVRSSLSSKIWALNMNIKKQWENQQIQTSHSVFLCFCCVTLLHIVIIRTAVNHLQTLSPLSHHWYKTTVKSQLLNSNPTFENIELNKGILTKTLQHDVKKQKKNRFPYHKKGEGDPLFPLPPVDLGLWSQMNHEECRPLRKSL